jgi:hypothetical protein
MQIWSDDLSKRTFDEIVRSLDENRAWRRELRLKSSALVNSRLAKEIRPEEYVLNRDIGKQEAAECKRRTSILVDEISRRRFAPVAAA